MIAIDIVDLRIEDLTPRRNDNGTGLDGQFSLFILEIDGLGRTELFTDSASPFGKKEAVGRINDILQGNGLGILHMDRLSLTQTRIIFIVYFCWTFLSTEAAGDTLRRVHVTGLLYHLDLKISFFPRDALHLGEGQELNVEMPADLDQFGRKDSHGAVIGGEGLVQLGHDTTDGGGPFHEIDIVAGIGQIQSCLHSGNASTHHHD